MQFLRKIESSPDASYHEIDGQYASSVRRLTEEAAIDVAIEAALELMR